MSARSSTVHTIAIGGAAGDGIRDAGINFSEFLTALGHYTFLSFEYPSLIRGGHNYARISYAEHPVRADYSALDVLIALNAESVLLHLTELNKDALVIVESAYADQLDGVDVRYVPIPMKQYAEDIHAPQAARTSSAFGAYAYALGIPLEDLRTIARVVFANVGADLNTKLAERGYAHMEALSYPRSTVTRPQHNTNTGELMDGNKAVAKGLLAAGLEAYVGYPMTPSTTTLHYLARAGKERGILVVHPEDEIAVINMALGMVYAGKRTAIGTANGGFALMQEAFSLAGIAELPIVILESMRMGPATGVATRTSQGDLQFTLHAGHGEFPRFVVAPGDVEECFTCAADAMNLAWKYQIPAVILSDKHLSESHTTFIYDEKSKGADLGKRADITNAPYKRYAQTDDGISPIAFPGTPTIAVKVTSYEHNEDGEATDDSRAVRAMHDKRFRKLDSLYKEFEWFPTLRIYGDESADTAIVFWGSTKGALLEAHKMFTRPVKLVQVLWMEPFDAERMKKELAGMCTIIDVEANHTAQLAALIREKTSIEIVHKILKYDTYPFTPTELAAEINALL